MTKSVLDAARIVAVGEKHGVKFSKQVGTSTTIYLEGVNSDGSRNNNQIDKWNDQRTEVAFDAQGKPTLIFNADATTEPGIYYDSTHVIGRGGAALIASGLQQWSWQFGYHHSDPDHPALIQTGGEVTVFRDYDRSFRRQSGHTDTGWFGINQHGTAGNDGDPRTVSGHSAGCLVVMKWHKHLEWVAIKKNDIRFKANPKFIFDATVYGSDWVDEIEAMDSPSVVPEPAPIQPGGGTFGGGGATGDFSPLISQAAIDLIVVEEISSRADYDSKYHHPEWPGGASGITIGIGYDVGYSTKKQLHDDWDGLVPAAMITALEPCVGVTGTAANGLLGRVKNVDIPWDAAMAVFSKHDIPKWYKICVDHLPNFEKLSPDCKGALLSLAYNRGPSFDEAGDRYAEMRNIKRDMITENYSDIPKQLRSMKRIWAGQGLDGLIARREHEAVLFEKGLTQPTQPPVVAPVPPPSPPVSTTTKVVVSTGVVVAAGTASHLTGMPPAVTIGIIIGAAVLLVAGLIFMFVKKQQQPGV